MQIGKSVKIPVCNVDVSRLLSFRLHTACFFYISHTFAFFLGVRDENTRQIDCFTAHFVAEGGRGVPSMLLVNKFISTYEYKNIRQCPA